MKNDYILVSEIFGPTLQGEGAMCGQPTVFVRTGGCDFECSWCDSLHSVLVENLRDWSRMTAGQIMLDVRRLSGDAPCLVTLSGGNPALQRLEALIDYGHSLGYTFAMETQGTVSKDWFQKLDHVVLSPKPPSSGMPFSQAKLSLCLAAAGGARGGRVSVKVVVMDEEDYLFAKMVWSSLPASVPFFITPGNHTPPNNPNAAPGGFDAAGVLERTRWVAKRMAADRWHAPRVIPQLHTLLWQNEQGV